MIASDEDSPSYWVEHLATFAVGKQYGLEWPNDGIHKLRQMERNSAVWAQPMVLRLRPDRIIVEDEGGVRLSFHSPSLHEKFLGTRRTISYGSCRRPHGTSERRPARRLQ